MNICDLNLCDSNIANNSPNEKLETYEGLEKLDPITVKIDNTELTDERLFYISKFCNLKFADKFSHNINELVDNNIVSMSMKSYVANIKYFPNKLKNLFLNSHAHNLQHLPLHKTL